MRKRTMALALPAVFSLAVSVMLVGGGEAAASSCYVAAKYGNTPIYVNASVSTRVVGHMTKGKALRSDCSVTRATPNGYYTSCGGSSNQWYALDQSPYGWVKALCVGLQTNA